MIWTTAQSIGGPTRCQYLTFTLYMDSCLLFFKSRRFSLAVRSRILGACTIFLLPRDTQTLAAEFLMYKPLVLTFTVVAGLPNHCDSLYMRNS